MAIGKRLRFQIFRRDNFACRYCGLTAADGAVLEVDHVTPRAEGGPDAPVNLVTACEGCNSGKSDIPLDAPLIEDIPQADFRAALAAREQVESRDPELPEWVHDLDIAAGVAWHQGFRDESPGVLLIGRFHISFALAVASGCSAKEVEEAAYLAGQNKSPDLVAYLVPDPPEPPEEEAAYRDSLQYLEGFIPGEQRRFIWRARAAAGNYVPTVPELIRAAEVQARMYVEEEGRDREALRQWLDRLPGNEGSRCLVRAAADWDANCQGKRGHSAMECPDEVLELAVRFALGAGVSA